MDVKEQKPVPAGETLYEGVVDGSSPKGYESPSDYEKLEQDWTPSEEKRLVLKYDLIILPLLTLSFFAMQMDRGNIGNAVAVGLLDEIGVSQSQYNVGQQLLYIGIVILELPSNLVLYRIGPRWWLGGQVIAWGFVETFQCFINDTGSFYATRLLLGLCEAGFIPASLYCLSLWYKRSETSKRFVIFYFGNLVSQGATSLLAFGIFHMDGIAGLYGWQWMFILEGIFTILVGAVLITLLPKDPNNSYPLSRISYFTPREREIMWKRVLLDDPSKYKKTHSVSLQQLWAVLKTWRIYPHLLISLCGIAPVTTLLQYAPSLVVAQMEKEPVRAQAIVSIGGWSQIVVSLILGIIADFTRRRGFALLAGVLCFWGFVIGDLVVRESMNATLRIAILIVTLAFCSTWQPLNGSWLSINAASPAERSITLAMFVMSTNIGGIIGSQLFQESDGPNYTVGWSAILGLVTVSLLSVIFANIMYRWLNRRTKRQTGDSDQEFSGEKRILFWL